jgi:hypothetical protein
MSETTIGHCASGGLGAVSVTVTLTQMDLFMYKWPARQEVVALTWFSPGNVVNMMYVPYYPIIGASCGTVIKSMKHNCATASVGESPHRP